MRRGEKSTMVTFWKKITVDDRDNPGKQRPLFLLKLYRVFNAEQADWPSGAPSWDVRERNQGERSHNAEMLVKEYVARGGPAVTFGGDRAFYRPATDVITVPAFADFDGPDEYYSTLFHECGHSTGHGSRLNRPGIAEFDHFGSERYSREELVAEMTSAMLAGVTGITTTLDNSAAYLRSWARQISEDPKLVVQAAGHAQRAADLILGTTYESSESES